MSSRVGIFSRLLSYLRKFTLGVIILAAPLALAEVALRIRAFDQKEGWMPPAPAPGLVVHLQRLWFAEPANDLWPPFPVYANRGYRDETRLKKIFAAAKLPPKRSWKTTNFLRKSPKAEYTVTTNSLGFRDKERSAAKPPGVKRVFCLGAYQTFGHGINDDETYPQMLEALLNGGSARGKYEVWNCGKQASTAIMGLALLKMELLDYRPDILALQYGFVDPQVTADNAIRRLLLLPREGPAKILFLLLRRMFNSFLSHSLLFQQATSRLAARAKTANTEWLEVMREIIAVCAARGIAVVILNSPTPVAPPPDVYSALTTGYPRSVFVDVDKAFLETPPPQAVLAAIKFSDGWVKEWERLGPGYEQAPYYRTDIFHPNKFGNRLTAEKVYAAIKRLERGQK